MLCYFVHNAFLCLCAQCNFRLGWQCCWSLVSTCQGRLLFFAWLEEFSLEYVSVCDQNGNGFSAWPPDQLVSFHVFLGWNVLLQVRVHFDWLGPLGVAVKEDKDWSLAISLVMLKCGFSLPAC